MSKFCPECGTSNKDEAMFCTNCGARLPDTPQTAEPAPPLTASSSKAEKPASPKKKLMLPMIIGIAAVAVIAIVLAVMVFSGSFDKMSATSKAGKGDYIGALESYEKYLSRSGKESTETLSRAALYALSAGDADKALMYARSVPEKSEESISVEGRAAMVLAGKAEKNEDWEKAVSILEGCSYSDAEEMLEEMRYNYGVELMSAENWEKAAEQFRETSYADSKDMLAKCEFAMSVDANFLSDIVTFCYGFIDVGFDTETEGFSALMPILEKYSSASFKDPELQEYATAFVSDMQIYESILSSNSSRYTKQQKMCDPLADAIDQLSGINKLYPFEKTDWYAISDHFKTKEYWKELSQVVRTIAEDMAQKTSSGYYTNQEQQIRVPNNTKYEVRATFWFYCYDSSYKLVSTDQVSTSLKRGTRTRVLFACVASKVSTWDYDFIVESFW